MPLNSTTESVSEYGFPVHRSPALESAKHRLESVFCGSAQASILDKITHNMSLLYMVYWFHRVKNPEQKAKMRRTLADYVYGNTPPDEHLLDRLFEDGEVADAAKSYVESANISHKTVDLVLMRGTEAKEILVHERQVYPAGLALPGGFILDEDESNDHQIPGYIFAALRLAAVKVLGTEQPEYGTDQSEKFYYVQNGSGLEIRIRFRNANGYRYADHLNYMAEPSDPRHLVDAVGMQCEVVGELSSSDFFWKSKEEIMDPTLEKWSFVFGHHRSIVAHLSARNPILSLEYEKHHGWIRSLVNEPETEHAKLAIRFQSNGNSINTSMPELAPVVKKIMDNLFSGWVNELCQSDSTLNGLRDKTVISLRHCLLGNRSFCPYLPTLEAIMKGVTFFDVASRVKRGFYGDLPTENIYEHDPRQKAYASYHMYRYEYRWNEIKGMLPEEIVIPTFEPLGATDLMKIRGVPVWFVGLSTDFTYVDEFEQSPEEFFMHDVNHSYRMILTTEEYQKRKGLTDSEFRKTSNQFIREYLGRIRILPADTVEQREIKKLKKIILFEIVHEDARVFTRDSIVEALQVREGGSVPFEVPHVNPEGWLEMVDTLDHGISPLSYVRNKLQHGFYDQTDSQITQIVHPEFRTSDWVARAAYEMLIELSAEALPGVATDDWNYISYDWLIERTCSVGPDNIHESPIDDPTFKKFQDGLVAVNPKRYQA